MLRNRPLLLVFRVVLGGLFIYAGVVKVVDPLGFAQDIRNYRLVGQSLSFLAALVLPWLEILAGAFLVSGVCRRGAALAITVLLVFFIVLTLVTMARGLDVDCGCFGSLSRKSGWSVVLEDLGMLALGLSLLLAPGPRAKARS
ncbi:MAG TPA: MauE/DoxX family redox-associated membrane protein [Candidatus Aminicenantes bacterium]|nr:MauE/DoxX family redox-associated membrane protein [Candidatus Aminicenantes bacterium]